MLANASMSATPLDGNASDDSRSVITMSDMLSNMDPLEQREFLQQRAR